MTFLSMLFEQSMERGRILRDVREDDSVGELLDFDGKMNAECELNSIFYFVFVSILVVIFFLLTFRFLIATTKVL